MGCLRCEHGVEASQEREEMTKEQMKKLAPWIENGLCLFTVYLMMGVALWVNGCGIRGYHLAGGTGDVTHAIEPEARVIVPNHQKKVTWQAQAGVTRYLIYREPVGSIPGGGPFVDIGPEPLPPRATYRVVETPEGGRALLNDLRFTPGEIRTTNRALVCSESTKTIRKPGLQEVYVLYGATKKPGICCEIDHLISLELGGANTLQNEWPQPYEPRPGAREKDEVENWLHKQVCEGIMPLESAQNRIATNWYAVYQEMQKEKK